MTSLPDDPEALLTRDDTAAALTKSGFPTSAKTLATKASRGGGPPFHRFGPRVLYRWRDALAWAQNRLGPTLLSTSEAQINPRRRPAAGARALADDANRGDASSSDYHRTEKRGR